MRGNASIDIIDLDKETITNDVFKSQNGTSPGDVAHSGVLVDSFFYLVMNNSGKVIVINTRDFSVAMEITGFTSPRYLLPISATQAYVTDLYANHIYLTDLSAGTITDSIPLYGMGERMVMLNGKVFVANNKSSYLAVVDPKKHALVDSIEIGGYTNEIRDMAGTLIVLKNANSFEKNQGAILTIDPMSHTIISETRFTTDIQMWYGRTAQHDGVFYFNLGNEIFAFQNDGISSVLKVEDIRLNNFAVIKDGYWLTNAKDYQQKGEVIQFSKSGTEINRFSSGIIPSSLIQISF